MKRADFLQHVGWTGAGIAYTLSVEGLFTGTAIAGGLKSAAHFVQISDSHIGFHQAANHDVSATLKRTVDIINTLSPQPQFVVHTGDVTHLSKPEQFAAAKDILQQLRAPLVVLPGEHDFIGGDHRSFFQAFQTPDARLQWYSWDRDGIHYVALINVFSFEKMGLLGTEQLAWLQRDLAGQKGTTPIVVFAHVPLYALYAQWGWTTEDGAQALALLKRFDRVTVLNGHIHQVIRHSEGNISFATADATAYPQPAPGKAPRPGPLTLPPDRLLHAIGYRTVELQVDGSPIIGDKSLAG